ncbi:MFS transporter [Lactobacillus agrestimuris]|uniref:MFS transporter n=1 Tax=Lactobacillus agrestimuris TaxID=2941328 RepID=UPI0020447639|nr:MFS transporter [Lactobacillus agrestimuris]
MSGIFSLFYANNHIPTASISSIKSFQSIGIMVGLLPAGYLSDRIGRLKILNLSAIVISLSFLSLILFRTFVSFSISELLYGIGLALNSGTLLSYITDLQEQNDITPDSRLMGKQVIMLNLMTLVGGNIGTYLFNMNNTTPIWFALIGLAIYPIFAYTLIKYLGFADNKSTNSNITLFDDIKMLRSFLQKKKFWILLLLNVGYDCGTQFILIYWSIIYVDQLHFELSVVYTLFMLSLILGSIVFNNLVGALNTNRLVIVSTLFMIGLLILNTLLTNRYILLSLFLLIELVMGMMSGQISSASNIAIYGENNKSLMLSSVSFLTEIIVSLSLFLNDRIIKLVGNLKVMYIISALYFAIILLVIPLLKKERNSY